MPAMIHERDTGKTFRDVVNEIFAQKTRQDSHAVIDAHSKLWTQMASGSQGFSGKKAVNSRTKFNELFTFE
jgi:hypothetical protein